MRNQKLIQQYYQVSAFGGIPVMTAVSLQEEDGSFKLAPILVLLLNFHIIPSVHWILVQV